MEKKKLFSENYKYAQTYVTLVLSDIIVCRSIHVLLWDFWGFFVVVGIF